MADSIKAQKLAAARKKLKEFQQKNSKNPKGPDNKENVTPQEVQSAAGSLASSTHSLDISSHQQPTLPYWGGAITQDNQSSSIQNYFSVENTTSCVNQPPVNFFDSYCNDNLQQNNNHNQSLHPNGDGDSQGTNQAFANQIAPTPEQFFSYEIRDEDVTAEDYPELKHNEVFNRLHNLVEPQGNQNVAEISDENVASAPAESELPLQMISNEKGQPLGSSLESLNQLSSQLHHIVSDYESYDLKHNNDLEKRNQELAGLLEQEKLKSEQLQSELNDYKNKLSTIETESQQTKADLEERISRELGPLQEQLQYHMQTVGILVAEKTELTASLSQSQILAKQKTAECEELQGRLKTSRSRAADLEKELNTIKAEKSKFDKIGSEKNEEVTNLKQEVKTLTEQKEEIAQDLSELREKFNISASENLKLQHEIQELSAQLSLANVKIQQLSAGESMQSEMHVEELVQQKLILEKHISELHQNIKTVTAERDQASVQYQQYTQQLNTQLSNIAQKLEATTQQNEALVKREQDLVQHIGELEKHLQSLQNEHVNFTAYKNNNGLKKELEESTKALEDLRKQVDTVDGKLEVYQAENEDLLKELAAKKEIISEMESKIERMEGNQPDSAKLLAAMESDKVAAARAVTQNTQLKKQLEDMEEVFIKISNDKLDLTEQLTTVQHQNRELTEKLHQVENQLHTLAEAIEIKDRELTLIREGSSELNKQVLQQNQLTDRLRHYEAQEHTLAALQKELEVARQQIDTLSKENDSLKETKQEATVVSQIYTEEPPKSDVNTEECEALRRTIEELEKINKNLEERLYALESNPTGQAPTLEKGDESIQTMNLDKEEAMKQLEEKFKKTMEDIANLQDEKQRLEHVILQLQGETETIGEYIALYQHQRGILNQRAIEKENQLKKITHDREQMRFKLEQLNSLIRRLIMESDSIPQDILEQHRQITEAETHSCTGEHQHYVEPLSDNIVNGSIPDANHNKTQTAQKIIALLTEIKTNNLVTPSDITENFHPCPCCSGLLLTV